MYTVGTDLLDSDGHIRDAYGEEGYVLVRPDGYIGAVTSDPVQLSDYLTRLGHRRRESAAGGVTAS